jgi:hypothetical protein
MPVYKFITRDGWSAGAWLTGEQYNTACAVASESGMFSPVTVEFGDDGANIIINTINACTGITPKGIAYNADYPLTSNK